MVPRQSAARHVVGPARLVLTASVARRHYIDGKSKIEIGEELQLSRFKVARLLEEARASGLVRIEIGNAGRIDVGLSGELRDAYHLQHAIVVDTVDDDAASLRSDVGRAAAELLSEIVTTEDVLGLGWARSLMAMRSYLSSLPACSVVQLTGALSRPDVDSSIELVRDVARIANGPAYYFYYPMIAPDARTASALRREPEVARAFDQFASVTKAVVGLGSWDPPYSTVYDAISPAERKALHELGVRAEVTGVLLDADGVVVDAPLAQRIIGIGAAQLSRVPQVIAIVYGVEKARAARAAIVGGFITGLVTHTSVAHAMVSAA